MVGYTLATASRQGITLVGREICRKTSRKTCKTKKLSLLFTGTLRQRLRPVGTGMGQDGEDSDMMTPARHRRRLLPTQGSSSFSLHPLPASFLPAATSAPRSFGQGAAAALWAVPTLKKIRGGGPFVGEGCLGEGLGDAYLRESFGMLRRLLQSSPPLLLLRRT